MLGSQLIVYPVNTKALVRQVLVEDPSFCRNVPVENRRDSHQREPLSPPRIYRLSPSNDAPSLIIIIDGP